MRITLFFIFADIFAGMPKISCVVITLNEERNLARCLESVREVADEIVVVDSFSTDRTEEIARSFGAKFIQHPFTDYVSQHKFADAQASYDHILTIDADEALSPKLAESIRQVKRYWKADGYMLNRLTNYCGKWIRHSGWYPDKKLRLYDRRKGSWTGLKLHEKFLLKTKCVTGFLPGDLYHYSFYTVEEHLQQAARFGKMAAEALIEKGQKIPRYYLVMKPWAKFIRNYFLKLGFLDGTYGYIICRIAAFETLQKYALAYQAQQSDKT
ncbi:MAG: glycosyltransferase family 2 protein [Bacteroidales bacterium]